MAAPVFLNSHGTSRDYSVPWDGQDAIVTVHAEIATAAARTTTMIGAGVSAQLLASTYGASDTDKELGVQIWHVNNPPAGSANLTFDGVNNTGSTVHSIAGYTGTPTPLGTPMTGAVGDARTDGIAASYSYYEDVTVPGPGLIITAGTSADTADLTPGGDLNTTHHDRGVVGARGIFCFQEVTAAGTYRQLISGYRRFHAQASAFIPAGGAPPPEDSIAVSYGGSTGRLRRSSPATRTGTLPVSGSYVGTPTAIEYRIYDEDAGAAVAGHDWQTLIAAPSGGAFSATIAGIPEGGGRGVNGTYRADVRFANNTALTGSSATFGVGPLLMLAGQSNMVKWGTAYGTPPVLGVLCRRNANTNPSGSEGTAPVGNGEIRLANDVTAETGIPICFGPKASSGTSITQWEPGQSLYNQLEAAADNGNAIGTLWNQGEFDDLMPYAEYRSRLPAIASNLRTDTGLASFKFIVLPVLYSDSTSKDRAGLAQVRRAQYDFQKDSPHNHTTAHFPDLTGPYMNDGLHLEGGGGVGYEIMAARAARAVINILTGSSLQERGPAVTAVERVSETQTRVTLAHAGGLDFSPTSAITGFDVSDETNAETGATGVREDATHILLTHAALTSAVRKVYFMGFAPDVSTPVLADDNGFPVEPEAAGQAAPAGQILGTGTGSMVPAGAGVASLRISATGGGSLILGGAGLAALALGGAGGGSLAAAGDGAGAVAVSGSGAGALAAAGGGAGGSDGPGPISGSGGAVLGFTAFGAGGPDIAGSGAAQLSVASNASGAIGITGGGGGVFSPQGGGSGGAEPLPARSGAGSGVVFATGAGLAALAIGGSGGGALAPGAGGAGDLGIPPPALDTPILDVELAAEFIIERIHP